MPPILLAILLFVYSSNSLPLSEFFPFGTDAGDSRMRLNGTESEGPFNLSTVFPYFDNNNRQIWILNNGLFSFLPPRDFSLPRPFSSYRSSSVVAGFWHTDSQYVGNETENDVYYQIYNQSSSAKSISIVSNMTRSYVRRFYPEQRVFAPTVIIIGTWYYITYETNETSQLNNTFQIVLSTDGDRSFAFFLYHDLQWASPFNETGSYAQAGFSLSAENATEKLPHSGTADVVRLMDESNVNVPGLFVFRIDTSKINAGGCAQNTSTVSFRPRMGSFFGSTPMTIHGPCFTNQTTIKCRFGASTDVDGFVVDQYRAVCLTPIASAHERVSVHVSINNGSTNISSGMFIYTPLPFDSDEVTVQTIDGDGFLVPGQHINLTWQFSEMLTNMFANDTKIDIQLWQLDLKPNSPLEKHPQAVTLGINLSVSSSARVQLPQSISNISTCFIQVTARSPSRVYVGLNTGLLIVRIPPAVAPELCRTWAKQQSEPSSWNSDGLLQCPMTRSQAIAGGFCCYKRDEQCYKDSSNPRNCRLHQARPGRNEPSAVECYVSHGFNRHGAGTECCYDSSAMLITRGRGAGTDDRYQPMRSPVEHLFRDTLPYLQCCFMSNDADSCNEYMYYRPPRRGSNTMGDSGRMWGDPHFGTLDGTSYIFNGYGEYTYLAVINESTSSPSIAFNATNQSFIFMSQVRTVPVSTNNTATVTKGFAARSGDESAESVSVTISHRQQLILRRGNEILEFEENVNTLFFPEMTINRLDSSDNSHFSLSWSMGITVAISVIRMTSPSEQSILNIATSAARMFRNRTYGLLGTYDGIAENDLRSKNGSVIPTNASLEEIHTKFGHTWAIEPSASLFYYERGQSAEFFQNKSKAFIPSWVDPTRSSATNGTIRGVCAINPSSSSANWSLAERACYYDMFTTNDDNFARTSLSAGNELLAIRRNQRNVPLFNSSLPLNRALKAGDPVLLRISASSEENGHPAQLAGLHLPKNAVFNANTGVFQWIAAQGEDYFSVQARDTTNNLTSKHDINFQVAAGGQTTTPSHAGINVPTTGEGFYLLMVALFMLLR